MNKDKPQVATKEYKEHNEPQVATKNHREPQQVTISCKDLQRATVRQNEPFKAAINPNMLS